MSKPEDRPAAEHERTCGVFDYWWDDKDRFHTGPCDCAVAR